MVAVVVLGGWSSSSSSSSLLLLLLLLRTQDHPACKLVSHSFSDAHDERPTE